MINIFKRLVKSNLEWNKKYALFYQTNMYDNYELDFCNAKELKEKLEEKEMYSYYIFLRKDELEVKTEIDFNFNDEVEK